jgi:molybdopterin synthase catalytic subunit
MPIRIQTEDFDLSAAVATLRNADPKVGAVVSFVGTVRDMNDGVGVTQLELEHYPGMTEKALEDIVAQAKERWPVAEALVIHRVGPLKPLEQVVLVAVSSAHRGEAFAACEFIIDYLKTAAPFWKKEDTAQGARWVDARDTDEQALAKWNIVRGEEGEEAI